MSRLEEPETFLNDKVLASTGSSLGQAKKSLVHAQRFRKHPALLRTDMLRAGAALAPVERRKQVHSLTAFLRGICNDWIHEVLRLHWPGKIASRHVDLLPRTFIRYYGIDSVTCGVPIPLVLDLNDETSCILRWYAQTQMKTIDTSRATSKLHMSVHGLVLHMCINYKGFFPEPNLSCTYNPLQCSIVASGPLR